MLKCYEKSVQWEPGSMRRTELWTDGGRTDRHDEAYGRFSQICECAEEPICLER
jgi:hypothetical protein